MTLNGGKTLLAIILALILLIVSCEPNESSSLARVKLGISAEGLTSNTSNGRIAAEFQIDSALIALEEIELQQEGEEFDDDAEYDSLEYHDGDNEEEDGDNEDELEFEFEGPFIIDLISGTSTPELPIAEIPAEIGRASCRERV